MDFCPLSLKVVWGPPLYNSFLGFTCVELQVYKLLPKSECRFYLGEMTLSEHILNCYLQYTAVINVLRKTTISIWLQVILLGSDGASGENSLHLKKTREVYAAPILKCGCLAKWSFWNQNFVFDLFLCVNFWVNAFLGLEHLCVCMSLQQMFNYSRFPKLKDPSGTWNSFIAEEVSL